MFFTVCVCVCLLSCFMFKSTHMAFLQDYDVLSVDSDIKMHQRIILCVCLMLLLFRLCSALTVCHLKSLNARHFLAVCALILSHRLTADTYLCVCACVLDLFCYIFLKAKRPHFGSHPGFCCPSRNCSYNVISHHYLFNGLAALCKCFCSSSE